MLLHILRASIGMADGPKLNAAARVAQAQLKPGADLGPAPMLRLWS